jgi:hypothetical protein
MRAGYEKAWKYKFDRPKTAAGEEGVRERQYGIPTAEEIKKFQEEEGKKINNVMAAVDKHGDNIFKIANIGESRQTVIMKLMDQGKQLTEKNIKNAIQELMIANRDQVEKAIKEYEKRATKMREEMEAKINANPSLPCILKQQQSYFRHVEEMQMTDKMSWSSY